MGTGMNLKISFVLHFSHVLYWLSTKGMGFQWGVYRCSLGQVFNVNTCWPRLVTTWWHDLTSLLFRSWHRCWPMPRHDYRRIVHTQNYDRTSRIPWKLHRQTHFFHHKNQTPLGESHVECWGILISRNQTHNILRFDSWALTQNTNPERESNSSFRVPY